MVLSRIAVHAAAVEEVLATGNRATTVPLPSESISRLPPSCGAVLASTDSNPGVPGEAS